VTELLPKMDFSKHADFEGDKKTPPKKIEKLEKEFEAAAERAEVQECRAGV